MLVRIQVKTNILIVKPDLNHLLEKLLPRAGGLKGQKSITLTISGPLIVALGLKMLL